MKTEQKPKKDQAQSSNETATSSFIVNPPFRGNVFPANKKLDDSDWAKLEKTIPKDERLLFVIVGDLSVNIPCNTTPKGEE